MLFHVMLISQGKVALELEMATPLQYSLGNPTDRGAWRAASPWGCSESDTTK